MLFVSQLAAPSINAKDVVVVGQPVLGIAFLALVVVSVLTMSSDIAHLSSSPYSDPRQSN